MYTFKKEHKIYPNSIKSTITVETDAVVLEEIVEEFAAFLKGCGFDSKLVNIRLLEEDYDEMP